MNRTGILASAANYSSFLDLYAYLRLNIIKSHLLILVYHRVSLKCDDWSLEPLNSQKFDYQMRYFKKNYKIISLDDLVDCIMQKKRISEKIAVITFDDGYKDNYTCAYPILKKYHIPATIFLTTGHIGAGRLFWWDRVSYILQHTHLGSIELTGIGNFSLKSEIERYKAIMTITEKLKKIHGENVSSIIDGLSCIADISIPIDLGKNLILSWDEIREMSQFGINFGAHTVNHPILTNIPLKQAMWEIIQSKKDIENQIGQRVTAFSYPNGGYGDFNSEIAGFIKKSGFACAVAVSPSKLINPNDNLYELSRIGMHDDFNKSKVQICGLWSDYNSFRNVLSNYNI